MLFNTNIDRIQLVETELLIHVNSMNQKKIPLNEIKKVFVTVKKIPVIYEIA